MEGRGVKGWNSVLLQVVMMAGGKRGVVVVETVVVG